MTNVDQRSGIADELYAARSGSRAPSGMPDAPMDFADALTLQLDVLKRFQKAGETLGGWKVGLTSGTSRDRMGKGFRPFGFVLSSRIFRTGAKIDHRKIFNLQIEPELALVIGKPLCGANISVAEARAAVRGVAPAFEINEIRARGMHDGIVLADGLAQWGIVLGEEVTPRDALTGTTVKLFRDNAPIADVTPNETMDDPYLSLTRLCAQLHKHGLGLEPGQPVITGSFCHEAVSGPAKYRAEFSGIGPVSVEFTGS